MAQVTVDARPGFRVGSTVALQRGGHSVVYNYRILATGANRALTCFVSVGMHSRCMLTHFRRLPNTAM
jgi:hypothetical protein